MRDLAICDEHHVLHCVLISSLSHVDFAFNFGWLIPSEMVTGPTCNYPLSINLIWVRSALRSILSYSQMTGPEVWCCRQGCNTARLCMACCSSLTPLIAAQQAGDEQQHSMDYSISTGGDLSWQIRSPGHVRSAQRAVARIWLLGFSF
jgi:hypothetical protein